MKSFIVIASYYRRCVRDFTSISSPLTDLTGGYTERTRLKNCMTHWTKDSQTAFEKLRSALVNADVLYYPNLYYLFILETDASLKGYGSVLSQKIGWKN